MLYYYFMSFQTILIKFAYLLNLTRLIERRDFFFFNKRKLKFDIDKRVHKSFALERGCLENLHDGPSFERELSVNRFENCFRQLSYTAKFLEQMSCRR